MEINSRLKKLRKNKGLTQKSIADKLCMARTTYSKLESGRTALPYEKLISISKILEVPVYEIIQENGDLFSESLFDKFSLMLYLTEHTLTEIYYRIIPYEELQPEHLELLSAKGFFGKEAYEATPLRGRIYDFGPKDVFRQMMQHYGMRLLFKEKLIKNDYWLKRWNAYKRNLEPGLEIDDKDYFIVHIILLKMTDCTERLVQMAERDFPKGADEWDALDYVVETTGAYDAEYMATSCDGYDPFTEIVK